MKLLKLGYFQGQTVNLPGGTIYSLYIHSPQQFHCITAHHQGFPADVGKRSEGRDVWFNPAKGGTAHIDATLQAVHRFFG